MKYVMLQNNKGLRTPLIFPNHVPHVSMGRKHTALTIAHNHKGYGCPRLGEAVSAGFIRFTEDKGVQVYGKSESLKLKHDDRDAIDITRHLDMDDWDKDK